MQRLETRRRHHGSRVTRAVAAVVLGAVWGLGVTPAALASSESAYAFGVSGGSFESTASATIGFRITAEQSMVVTALGIVDSGAPGLASAHEVGLWTDAGTLLASATVAAGTDARLADGFRFADIAPIALNAGQTYRIGAVFFLGNGDNEIEAVMLASPPSVTLLDPGLSVSASGSLLGFPVQFSAPNAAAANFQFEVGIPGVPELRSDLLLVLGLAGLAAWVRRRSAPG